ncbi:copper chaperone PCu(A)C [Solilutibacter silvestris]|uniref:Copper chaperone PCu(A)C n=1 Tax=Solilutibacter silvestris TaxID=1645665 RepID=A0A2K1PY28_9GAMM|nr:copper chaperone PCu(A)C [Lysobacter silvestris]PNS07696.1 hypothetical protein Lysil_1872 [Lysobacter silvestris]
MKIKRTLLVLALVCLSLPAFARGNHEACAPVVRDGWIRLVPGGMPMHAGFGRIENPCGAVITIIGAGSADYGDVSLHETRVVDGISKMRAVPSMPVPARGDMEMKPGGIHLMLMEPKRPLRPGDHVTLRFVTGKSAGFSGDFVVRAMGE